MLLFTCAERQEHQLEHLVGDGRREKPGQAEHRDDQRISQEFSAFRRLHEDAVSVNGRF